MSSIFSNMLKDKEVYDRLQKEIDDAERNGELSHPITFNEAMRLPYLVAVCKEGMRVFPSVGMTLPRHVPPGGRVISDVLLSNPKDHRIPPRGRALHNSRIQGPRVRIGRQGVDPPQTLFSFNFIQP